MKGRAEENLKEAREKKEAPTYLYAAEALFKYYSGRGLRVSRRWTSECKKPSRRTSARRCSTSPRAFSSMAQGDLERAKEALDKAQGVSPDDPRIYVALGNLHRRRGNDAGRTPGLQLGAALHAQLAPRGAVGHGAVDLD